MLIRPPDQIGDFDPLDPQIKRADHEGHKVLKRNMIR
jgi:hypothetical protein